MEHEEAPSTLRLGLWRLHLGAAGRPLLARGDRPFDPEAPVIDVPDALRYVATARGSLKGPLALEIEGPGDPLASPESVLRILAMTSELHPDVLTGLVIDGPLLADYTEELEAFGLGYLVLRFDAVEQATAERLISGALYRGEKLGRAEAARLYVEEARRALSVAREHGFPVAVRTTLIPTLNAREIEAIATRALAGGAERMDVVPHVPRAGDPLGRAGAPTKSELAAARTIVREIFGPVSRRLHAGGHRVTDWLNPERVQAVDLDELEAVEVLRVFPDPLDAPEPARVLPPRRALFVAVASRDGTHIDESLAATPFLRIYAVTSKNIRCLGLRQLEASTQRHHDGVGTARTFLRVLAGCRAVVTTGFSSRAITLLRAVGVRPVAATGPVEAVLDRVARGTMQKVN